MTATNVWLTPQAGYLLTDAAGYDHEGTVLSVFSKVVTCEEIRLAIAFSGMATPVRIKDHLEKYAPCTAQEAVEALPAVVRSIRAENREGNPDGEAGGHNHLMLFAVGWSHSLGFPVAAFVGSHCPWALGFEGYSLQRIMGASSPPVDLSVACGRPVRLEAPSTIDAARDALKIIEAQRLVRQPHSIVGGRAELTTVTAAGVSTVVLKVWPDVIGERIAA